MDQSLSFTLCKNYLKNYDVYMLTGAVLLTDRHVFKRKFYDKTLRNFLKNCNKERKMGQMYEILGKEGEKQKISLLQIKMP